MLKRTLQKNDKEVTLTANDTETGKSLAEQSKTKVKQGWAPTSKPPDAVKLFNALVELHLWPADAIKAFTDAEVEVIYKQLILDESEALSGQLLRARPTRPLLEALMTKEYNLGSDLSKDLKFVTKDDAVAAWVRQVMEAALKGSPSAKLKKFANQQLKNLEVRAAPAPEAPAVVAGDETSLLQQIAANPTDDAPRLVYADFLTEKGIGWGEVIPLLLKPEPAYGTPEYRPHVDQIEKLTKKHLKAWLEPIRPFITGWSTNEGRGLLSSVTTQPGKFIEAADAIALRAPRAWLDLGGLKVKEVPALAATPLGRFQQVHLSQQRLDDAQVAVLAASPSLLGVEKWNLSDNPIGDAGLEALAASPNFARCVELSVACTVTTPLAGQAGLRAMLTSPHWPALRQLQVSVVEVGSVLGETTLALEYLAVDTTGTLNDDTLRSVASAKSLQGLTALRLAWSSRVLTQKLAAGHPFSDAALVALVEALPKLKSLSIENGVTPEAVKVLLAAR